MKGLVFKKRWRRWVKRENWVRKRFLIGGLVTSFEKLFTKPLIFLLRAIQKKSLLPVYFAETTESDSLIFKVIHSLHVFLKWLLLL